MKRKKKPSTKKPARARAVHGRSEDRVFVDVTKERYFIHYRCANFMAPAPKWTFRLDLVPGLRGWFRPGSSTPVAGPGEGTASA